MQLNSKTKFLLNKRAAAIVGSLISEGYRLRAKSDRMGLYFLAHSNGNLMRVEISDIGISLFKNNTLVKCELI